VEEEKKLPDLRRLGIAAAAFVGLALLVLLLCSDGISFSFRDPRIPANPYGPGDFAYEDGFLTCLVGESVLGIDVSEHQGQIDFQAVKAAGIEFVIIRLGYRGYETGILHEDSFCQTYYTQAKAAGLKVGAYFFSQAVSVEEARQEANFAMEVCKDWELDLPLAYDWEYVSSSARTAGVGADLLTQCTIAFCDAVAAAGYTPMNYFNISQSENLLHQERLTGYDFWLAHYSDEMIYPYKVRMWQYTSSGSVSGINTRVDINLWFTYE
jgi:GH25 family lysozyme M1 (1,4-beta-N-acetylmuramidase)